MKNDQYKKGRKGRKEGGREWEKEERGRERVKETEIKDHDYSVSENVIEK